MFISSNVINAIILALVLTYNNGKQNEEIMEKLCIMCLGCYIRWGYIMYQLYAQACSTDFFEFIKHIKHFSFYKSDLHTFRMFRIWIKSLQVINRVTVNISLLQVHILWYKRMVSVYYEYLLLSSILTCVCMYSQWLHINILHVHAHQVFLTNFKYLQHAWSSSPEFSVQNFGNNLFD